MVWGAIASVAGGLMGKYADRQETRHNNKQQYVYNSWLQGQNQDFQKYMAQNAHQMEVQDLINAGLNPALSAHGSSASSIAGSSSPQGTSASGQSSNFGNSIKDIVDNINSLRQTNANITNQGKEADAAIKNAEANMKSAEAALINAQNNTEITEGGWGTKILGTKSKFGEILPEIIGGIAGLGFGGGAIKGAWKLGNSATKIANVFRKANKVPRKLRIKR